MNTQVWDSKIHILLGDVIYTHLYVSVDPTKAQGSTLAGAFTFQADVRIAGVEVFSTGTIALKNEVFQAKPTVSAAANLGLLQGEIDDWSCSPQGWATATNVHFVVSSKADVTVPISVLTSVVPGLGPLIGGTIGALFGKVRITIGHANAFLTVERDAHGSVTSINHVPISQAHVVSRLH